MSSVAGGAVGAQVSLPRVATRGGEGPRAALYTSSLESARGAEKVVFHLTRALAAEGRPVTLLLGDARGVLVDRLRRESPAIDVVELSALDHPRVLSWALLVAALARALVAGPWTAQGFSDWRDLVLVSRKARPPLLALRRWLRRESPHAVISFLHDPNIALALLAQLGKRRTRLIVSVRNHVSGSLPHAKSARSRAVPGAMRRAFPALDGVLAVGEDVRRDVLEITGLPESEVETLANPARWPGVAESPAASCPHPWLAGGAGPVLVAAGKLKRQKEFATLIRAFARLPARRHARLIVLGEGEERPALEALVRELGLAERVALPGAVPDPRGFFAKADLFVLCSAWEGLPNVLLEALACGCPVVATDCPGGPREILADGRYGRLVPVGDAAALATAIEATLDQPLPREELAAGAGRYAFAPLLRRYRELLFGAEVAALPVPSSSSR